MPDDLDRPGERPCRFCGALPPDPRFGRLMYSLLADVEQLRAAIRRHRDERGDSRCWRDDEALYAVLPEGYTPPARDSAVELARCRQYIASRHNPGTVYVSPQVLIEELEAECARLRERVAELEAAAAQPCDHDWEPRTTPAGPARCRLCGLTEDY